MSADITQYAALVPEGATIRNPVAMQRIDEVERRIVDSLGGEQVTTPGGTGEIAPVIHHFTPGLYAREIHMPAGACITSKIHRTRHPFVISKGRCAVYMGPEQWEVLAAPHFGITEPGTRRLLLILEDTVWTTFHVTDKTDVDEIAEEILIPYENPLLSGKEAA